MVNQKVKLIENQLKELIFKMSNLLPTDKLKIHPFEFYEESIKRITDVINIEINSFEESELKIKKEINKCKDENQNILKEMFGIKKDRGNTNGNLETEDKEDKVVEKYSEYAMGDEEINNLNIKLSMVQYFNKEIKNGRSKMKEEIERIEKEIISYEKLFFDKEELKTFKEKAMNELFRNYKYNISNENIKNITLEQENEVEKGDEEEKMEKNRIVEEKNRIVEEKKDRIVEEKDRIVEEKDRIVEKKDRIVERDYEEKENFNNSICEKKDRFKLALIKESLELNLSIINDYYKKIKNLIKTKEELRKTFYENISGISKVLKIKPKITFEESLIELKEYSESLNIKLEENKKYYFIKLKSIKDKEKMLLDENSNSNLNFEFGFSFDKIFTEKYLNMMNEYEAKLLIEERKKVNIIFNKKYKILNKLLKVYQNINESINEEDEDGYRSSNNNTDFSDLTISNEELNIIENLRINSNETIKEIFLNIKRIFDLSNGNSTNDNLINGISSNSLNEKGLLENKKGLLEDEKSFLEDEKLKYLPLMTEIINDLQNRKESFLKIKNKINSRDILLKSMVEFEFIASDPKRLFKSSFQLNKEERFRKTAYPTLVDLEKDILNLIENYEKEFLQKFNFKKINYKEYLIKEMKNRTFIKKLFDTNQKSRNKNVKDFMTNHIKRNKREDF